MKCRFGELNHKAVEALKEAYDQSANSFAESCNDTFDFKTCQRSNGTTYGVPDKSDCAQKGAKEISSASASLAASGAGMDNPFSPEKFMAKAGPELARTAFGFGGAIKAIGGAAGVSGITDVVGGAVERQEIRRTNQMREDNAVKAQTAAAKSKIKSLETALKYASSAEEKKMIGNMLAKAKMESGDVPPKVKALQTALVHASTPDEKAMIQGMIDKEMGIKKPKPKPAPAPAPAPAAAKPSANPGFQPSGGGISKGDMEAIESLQDLKFRKECHYSPNPNACVASKKAERSQLKGTFGDMGGLLFMN